MKVIFFFPHYFWSERETELPGGVWESDRRPRGLEHPAFKRAASERERTKACDQTEIPSGEKLLYMHWATVMEKSSGEGNQIALGGGKWQTRDEPCSVCPFCFNSGLIIFYLSSWRQKAVLLENSVWVTEDRVRKEGKDHELALWPMVLAPVTTLSESLSLTLSRQNDCSVKKLS